MTREIMLSNDPRRPTHRWFKKRYLESRKREYETKIKALTTRIDKLKDEFARSFVGDPEDGPGTLLYRIAYITRDLDYARDCLDAVNKSTPREKGVPRNAIWY